MREYAGRVYEQRLWLWYISERIYPSYYVYTFLCYLLFAPPPPAITAGGWWAGVVGPGVMSGYLQVGAATEGVIDHRG